MINTGLVPGAASISMLMRRHLNIDLTESQANVLWDACRIKLAGAGMHRTIAAAQGSYYGSVDRAVQADLTAMLWDNLVGMQKPSEQDSSQKRRIFDARLQSTLSQRGYTKAQAPISMLKRAV